MKLDLSKNWNILQDVHDTCEQLGLPEREDFMTLQGPQISEWEPLPELKHLQLLFSEHPYWGRELRYFNDAPWWYKKEFELALGAEEHIELCFTNVDYYCKASSLLYFQADASINADRIYISLNERVRMLISTFYHISVD